MRETVILNLGSIVLGLIAWILPIVLLVRQNKIRHERRAVWVAASLGACAASLCLQIFEMNHRVVMQDWSALMDTAGAVAAVCLVFLIVTIALNTVVLAAHFKGEGKGE